MTSISIAIPCYEYKGKGGFALQYLFETLVDQTFTDFNVVVADHSAKENRQIEDVCNKWSDKIKIRYLQNNYNRGNAPANFNYAMFKSNG